MVGNIEDLPRDAQEERLNEIAGQLVEIVGTSGEPLTTRTVIERAVDNLSIAQSQARYGLTYAKSTGRIFLDPATSILSTSHTSLAH